LSPHRGFVGDHGLYVIVTEVRPWSSRYFPCWIWRQVTTGHFQILKIYPRSGLVHRHATWLPR